MDLELILQAHRQTRSFVRSFKKNTIDIFAKYGMTFCEGKIMSVLNRGEACTKADVAEALQLKPAALTRALERLVGQGFITRKDDQDDKRFVRLSTTAKGKAIGKKVRQDFLDQWQHLLKNVSETKIKSYIQVVMHMNDMYQTDEQ